MSDLKLCRDCRWVRRDKFFVVVGVLSLGLLYRLAWRFARCARPELTDSGDDWVSPGCGEKCFAGLSRKYEHRCGAKGKYFEPRAAILAAKGQSNE